MTTYSCHCAGTTTAAVKSPEWKRKPLVVKFVLHWRLFARLSVDRDIDWWSACSVEWRWLWVTAEWLLSLTTSAVAFNVTAVQWFSRCVTQERFSCLFLDLSTLPLSWSYCHAVSLSLAVVMINFVVGCRLSFIHSTLGHRLTDRQTDRQTDDIMNHNVIVVCLSVSLFVTKCIVAKLYILGYSKSVWTSE